jgi:hypothetical protein
MPEMKYVVQYLTVFYVFQEWFIRYNLFLLEKILNFYLTGHLSNLTLSYTPKV